MNIADPIPFSNWRDKTTEAVTPKVGTSPSPLDGSPVVPHTPSSTVVKQHSNSAVAGIENIPRHEILAEGTHVFSVNPPAESGIGASCQKGEMAALPVGVFPVEGARVVRQPSSSTVTAIADIPLAESLAESASVSFVNPPIESVIDATYARTRKLFLNKEDIIDPSTLSQMVEGTDYVLLKHSPAIGASEVIAQNGLKSAELIATAENAPPEMKLRHEKAMASSGFGHDPGVIYFRPVVSGARSSYTIFSGDITIAVDPKKCNVFDQEGRERRNQGEYISSKRSIAEYANVLINLPKGQYLNSRGIYASVKKPAPSSELSTYYVKKTTDQYIPEVCINAREIEPKYFVTKAFIKART